MSIDLYFTVSTPDAFAKWYESASFGDCCCYYSGNLFEQRENNMREFVREYFFDGKVTMVQQRISTPEPLRIVGGRVQQANAAPVFAYLAIKLLAQYPQRRDFWPEIKRTSQPRVRRAA